MNPGVTERPRRRVTQPELDRILRQHDDFLAGRVGGRRAVLSYTDMSGLTLAGRSLDGADITASFLIDADLAGCNLSHANLFGCDLARANLRGARLVRADLRGASLRRADLTGADLFDADLREGLLAEQECRGVIHQVAVEATPSAATDLDGATMTGA